MTPLKAIRAKCLDCSGGSAKEVRECVFVDCPLFALRFGKRPESSRRVLSESRRAALKAGRDRHRTQKVNEGISL